MNSFFSKKFKIGSKIVGDNYKSLVIAEISANHNNKLSIFKKLVRAAKNSNEFKIMIDNIPFSFYISSILPFKNHHLKNLTFLNFLKGKSTAMISVAKKN